MAENQPGAGAGQGEPQGQQQDDLMGYGSTAALAAAKRSSDQEAKRIYEENKQLRDLLTQSVAAKQSTEDNPFEELATLGVPRGALQKAIQTEARNLVREELAPLVAAGTAREAILGQYPDFQKHEPHLHQFLRENPEVNEQYQWGLQNARHNPHQAQMAMEWAYLKYGEQARRSGKNLSTGGPDPSASALPQSSAQERNSSQGNNADAEKIKKAAEFGQKYGDWRPFAHERLKGVIPDSHFQG